MEAAYSDEGIVIRSQDSGEADKFITLVTRNHGLVNYIARGARRLSSKKSPHLDLFNLIKFQTGRGESPRFLNQVESLSFYPNLKSDYTKVGATLTITEILTHTLPAGVEDLEIFLSLKNFLYALNDASSKNLVNGLSRQFGLYIIRHLGYPAPKLPQTDKLSGYFESIMNHKIISTEIR